MSAAVADSVTDDKMWLSHVGKYSIRGIRVTEWSYTHGYNHERGRSSNISFMHFRGPCTPPSIVRSSPVRTRFSWAHAYNLGPSLLPPSHHFKFEFYRLCYIRRSRGLGKKRSLEKVGKSDGTSIPIEFTNSENMSTKLSTLTCPNTTLAHVQHNSC